MQEIIKKQELQQETISGIPIDYVKLMQRYLKGLGWTNTTDDQAWSFYVKCWGSHLNPFNDEIYAVFHKDYRTGALKLSTRTAYEVYIDRATSWRGGTRYWRHDAIFYVGDEDVSDKAILSAEEMKNLSCKVIFYNKQGDITRKQHKIHISEFRPVYKNKDGTEKENQFWDNFPKHMLEKCCVVRGLRMLGIKSISKLPYIREEMERQDATDKVETKEPVRSLADVKCETDTKEALKKVEAIKNEI